MGLAAVWLVAFAPLAAHADLYRWIDPASGSVKLSSLPPSDPRIPAEVVRYHAPQAAKPGASTPAAVADLEKRWHSLLTLLAGLTSEDFKTGSDELRQQLGAYEALRAELDRLDPGGAARRRAEVAATMERVRQGLASQPGTRPPQ